ncbi:MAG: nuclear transport factor 2 family protein [bacterium]
MTKEELIELSEEVLNAWNNQDVEMTLGCYTADLIYRDPNTRGNIEGADAMRSYLKRLFGVWDMNWELRKVFPFSDSDGGAFLWSATMGKDGGKAVVVNGVNLISLENGLIKRSDVYFDRTALAQLF